MAIGRRARGRRSNRRQKRSDERVAEQQAIMDSAYAQEEERIKEDRRRVQQEDVFQTTAGEGIAESANISLGFDDSLEDEDELNSLTGLVI